jgi:RNA recognition motif-containing protein
LSQDFFQFIFLNMNIYVSNLSFNVQDEDLREFFAEYGEVTSAKVIMDKFTNRSRGFGFVEMSDNAAAQKAIQELDGATVEGRAIKVSEAKPREERPGGGGGGQRRSFSGGGGNRW